MSGNPNWNPRLQTSSVRFPRKAVETPQIPANSTARPRPGAPFQPVYPNPITQIPTITAQADPSNPRPVYNQVYTLSTGKGDAIIYPGRRGIPVPSVTLIETAERYLIFSVTFAYPMSGTDHFVFTFTNQSTGETFIKEYKAAPRYIIGDLLPGILYTLNVAPRVNGIVYPGYEVPAPFTITAISQKNVELLGATLSGGDRSATISWSNVFPRPPQALQVENVAVDDNFGSRQLLLDVCTAGYTSTTYPGFVSFGNLTNGSLYIFTVTPYTDTGGIYEYGQPTTLPPYIPGPPSDLFITGITANAGAGTVTVCGTYDTLTHPVPSSTRIEQYVSTLSGLYSFTSQPITLVQDLPQVSYAAFTTSTGLFTAAEFASIRSTVSALPGSIQIDLLNDKGYFYTFPLTDVSTGGLGYTFGNSNFTKTIGLYSTASSYSVLFRSVSLTTIPPVSYTYGQGQTTFTILGLTGGGLFTLIGTNFANGLSSLRSAYSTIAAGPPATPPVPVITLGNQIVSLSFTGYDPTSTSPRPVSYLYTISETGTTYTSINPNVIIGGLQNGSAYTFIIQGFANGVYGPPRITTVTPNLQPPTNLFVSSISNYDVTLSFTPAFPGGADYYQITNQSGGMVEISGGLYKFQNLSANVAYVFTAKSFAYGSANYTLSSSVSASLIQEISSGYAQFLVKPSVATISYAATMIANIANFVPYVFTITSSGQSIPTPIVSQSGNLWPVPFFTEGTSVSYLSNLPGNSPPVSGMAYTVNVSGITFVSSTITLSGLYYIVSGGPRSLLNFSGQIIPSLSLTPVSNAYTFPITSMTPVYDGSGGLQWYNIANPNYPKSLTTFSGAITYQTSLSTNTPLFFGMVPTTYSGTISSAASLPTTPSAYVGPPGTLSVTASGYFSQRVNITVGFSGFVEPTRYDYREITGKNISGSSTSSNIVIDNLTNGLSYTFSISAVGNQVYGPTGISAGPFVLSTDAPFNAAATFSNTTATVTFCGYGDFGAVTYYGEMIRNGYPGTVVETLSQFSSPFVFTPDRAIAGELYGFKLVGVLNNISSVFEIVNPIIAGTPFTPKNIISSLSQDQIRFNWSSGDVNYNRYGETYTITEYLSNNGICNATGGIWTGISGQVYTISSVITASGTFLYDYGTYLEENPGYASFVLKNVLNFTDDPIGTKYTSNQIWLTLQQSGLTYTFPLSTVTPFGIGGSNTYANANYPKEPGDIFNPLLSISVTYSYGTGPRNGGTYSYEFKSFANQVNSSASNVAVYMFVDAVTGVPSVTAIGRDATVSFVQTNPVGTIYRVTNNYGATVSRAPYTFRNLSLGIPYTFSVVASNGSFVSVSSALSRQVYVGPPRSPVNLSASYFGQTATVYATDTTLSLGLAFRDTGTQNTGQDITTLSHTNVIQNSSGGGYWVFTGGGIKDSSFGFVCSYAAGGQATYSNDGFTTALYQFIATPSTGTIAVTLSAYTLTISGISLTITNSGQEVYAGTNLSDSYPVQFISYSNGFGIQATTGNVLLYYSPVPAGSDSLSFTMTPPAMFSDFQVSSIGTVSAPAAEYYQIIDQFGIVYPPSLISVRYTPSGLESALAITNIPYAITLQLRVTPYANSVAGPTGNVDVYIFTGFPGTPVVNISNTTATITVSKTIIGSVDTYFLDISGGGTIATLSAVATTASAYVFTYPDLIANSNYFFTSYTSYQGSGRDKTRVTVGPFEAGFPYPFQGITSASIIASSVSRGTYTISALVAVGQNSNSLMTTRVYAGPTLVASRSIVANQPQVYVFTVSSGAVYTLSATAFLNAGTTVGTEFKTISASPFSPRGVSVTISSSDRGATYRGIVGITLSSATTGASYVYGVEKDGVSTDLPSGVSTFNVMYGSLYRGYAYISSVLGGNLSSAIQYSGTCNVSLAAALNPSITYNSTNISLIWTHPTSGGGSFYTVTQTTVSGTTSTVTLSENIGFTTPTYRTTASLGTTSTFVIQGQSSFNPSSSLIYSPSVSASVTLVTLSVAPVANYFGTAITVSFDRTNLTFSSAYTFAVTCVSGTVTEPSKYASYGSYPDQTNYTFTASGTGQSLKFLVSPQLYGIIGPSAETNIVNLTASAMTNVTQSYRAINTTTARYTISWTPITTPGYTYNIQELSGSVAARTGIAYTDTSAQFTISADSSYQFQTYAFYNGIQSAFTTLSTIYTYTNPISGEPTTTYNGKTITVSWSANPEVDGNNSGTTYRVENIYNVPFTSVTTICSSTTATTISFDGVIGTNYQLGVTAMYNGFDSSRTSGVVIKLNTNPVTNVGVTNSGTNIVVTWSASVVDASAQNTIFYTLSQIGNGTIIGTGRFTTSATVYAPTTDLPKNANAFYNYIITASANGISSSGVSAAVSGLVFTYAPTNVILTYLGNDRPGAPQQPGNRYQIDPIVSWTNITTQSSAAFYTITVTDTLYSANSPEGSVTTAAGVSNWTNISGATPDIPITGNVGSTIVPNIYATVNGLSSTVVTGSPPVEVFTAQPGIIGVGFDGLYRITFNLCVGAGSENPNYYTIYERNDAYKSANALQGNQYPNSYFTVPYNGPSTVYTIPLAGIQGYTYNFGVYATRFGVVSTVNLSYASFKLETTPVTDTSMAVTYSGTIITFSWSEALQLGYDGRTEKPNGGYTIYVTPGNPFVPERSLYTRLSYQFAGGVPGQTYSFTILAVNNNITSSPRQSPTVTLYQPVVTNLTGTNTSTDDRDVSMTLTWTPDILNASGAQYRAVSFNQSTGATVTSNNIGENASTVTFNGSIGVAYTFFVQGIYKGISGLAQSIQISNARPRITSFTLTNLGNNIFAQYTVTPIGSIVTLTAYNRTSSTDVTSISYTSDTTATLTVSSSTGAGQNYSISATARYFGIPSTVSGRTYSMVQPNTPTSFTAGYNNALVSVSWTEATNASSYTFIAYDLCSGQQADIQAFIPQTFTTFVGTLGRSYSLSVTAFSETFIPSVTASASVAIAIPNPPSGLRLCNAGSLVTVTWTACSTTYSNYSFTVVNASSTGTIFYQSAFASPSDTFQATVGQTFRVNLFGTSICNVTSTSSAVSSLFIYQPSIPSVTATSVGADITLTFPGDARETCEYLVQDNYAYTILLYSPSGFSSDKYTATLSAKYTESANGYISYTILDNSYNLNGTQYQYTVTPQYKLVPGPSVLTSGVNPLTLYKPSTPGQFTVANQGSDLLLNWRSSAIATIPVPTLVPTYRVDVAQVISPFTSTSICGLQLWLDGSDPSGTGIRPTSSTPVSIWKDKSGKGQDGSATGGQSATYSLSSNGLVFAGAQAYSTTISSSISAQTGFAVVSYNTTNKINIISVTRTSGNGNPGIQQIINNNVLQLQPYGGAANVSGGTVTQNTPFIYDYTFSTVCGSSIYANGTNTATSSTTVTLSGTGKINIGGYDGILEGFSGTMFEVLLYDSVLSTGQRQQVEGYLARKWGLVQKLPATHPYGPWPNAISPQYITGTTTTFTGYNSDAGQLSISLTAIIPGYDQNLSATYINGFTSNKNFTIPNQTNVSIKQDDPANPQILSVRIPPLAAAWVWFLTTAYGTTTTPRGPYYTCNINTDPTQSLFQSYNVTVSTGLYYTVSAYGWFNNFDFPTTNPGTAPVIINANPNPYPATTFNVSYSSIKTSHSGTIITVSWAPVAQAAYYDVQEFDSTNVQIGGGGLLLNSPRWVSTVTHTAGSSYNFQITAFTISQASFNGIGLNTGATIDGLAVGAELPNSKNPYFPSPISSDETLYIPGPVENLNAIQLLQTVSLTWLQPNSWTPPPSVPITTTSADTTYFIRQLIGATVVSNVTISGGGTPSHRFNITPGVTYVFTVSTTYYGIPTTTLATTTLVTVNPSITSLTLTDNGNRTITLAGTANTAGDWYANISTGSTAVFPINATSANTTSFTINQDVTAGSSWTGFVKFIATLGGLTVTSNTAQLTLPNPAITTCSVTDNLTDGTLTLNLVASIGGSVAHTPRWTVPASVTGTGTGQPVLSLSTSPGTSASTIAVYKKALPAQTYSFTGITVSAGGFQSSASSASFTTPTFTVSQNPAQIIILNPRTLSATFFSPELIPRITAFTTPTTAGSFTLAEPILGGTITVNGAGGGRGGIGNGGAGGSGGRGGNAVFTLGALPAGTIFSIIVGNTGDPGQAFGANGGAGAGGIPGGGLGGDGASGQGLGYGVGGGGGGGGFSAVQFTSNGTAITLSAGGGAGGNGGINSQGSFTTGGIGGGGSIGGAKAAGAGATGGSGSFTGSTGTTGTNGGGALSSTAGSVTFVTTRDTSTVSWNFSTGLTNGGTFSSYAPLTGSGIVNVSYTAVPAGITATFPVNTVFVNYQGYTVSLGSVVSYATPNPTVTVGSTATRFVDNKNGTLTLFLVAAGCTQGSGNVTWSVPSSVNGNGTAPDALTVSGSPTTLSSSSVVYNGAKDGSTYTINVGGVTVAYSGYSNSNATSIVSLPVELPRITAITGVHFGCSEDKALTGSDSITVSVTSSLPNTWTITACSALTLNSTSGQGTTAIQWVFSGGLKTKAYDFTVGSCNVTVTLTRPSANVTPSFSSFNGGATPYGVVSAIANAVGQTFVWFTSNTTLNSTINIGSPITVNNRNNETLGGSITYTLNAASYLNGILGTPSSYNFSVAAIATDVFYGSAQNTNDAALATSNTVVITFKPGGSGPQTYALVSYGGTNIPSAPASSLPSGHVVLQEKSLTASTTAQSSFTVTLVGGGAKNYYIIVKTTTGYGIGSSGVSFTYTIRENIVSDTTAGSTGGIFDFPSTNTSRSLLYVTMTGGKGGAAGGPAGTGTGPNGGFGQTITINGYRGFALSGQLSIVPAGSGNVGDNNGTGGAGGAGWKAGGRGGRGDTAPGGGGGGGSARFVVFGPRPIGNAPRPVFLEAFAPGGGGGGANPDNDYRRKGAGTGGGGGGSSGAGGAGETGAPTYPGKVGTGGQKGGGDGGAAYNDGQAATALAFTGGTSKVADTGPGFSINLYFVT
jgi:hypothetical protein